MLKAQERALRGLGVWAVVTGGVLVWFGWGFHAWGSAEFFVRSMGWETFLGSVVRPLMMVGGGAWLLWGRPRVWVGWWVWGVVVLEVVWQCWDASRMYSWEWIYKLGTDRTAFLWLGWVVLWRKWEVGREGETLGSVETGAGGTAGEGGEGVLGYERRVVREDAVWIGLRFVVVWSGLYAVGELVGWWSVLKVTYDYAMLGFGVTWAVRNLVGFWSVLAGGVFTGWLMGLWWNGRLVGKGWRGSDCGVEKVTWVGAGMLVLWMLRGLCLLVREVEHWGLFTEPRDNWWIWSNALMYDFLEGYAPAVAVYWWLVWPVVKGGAVKVRSGRVMT